MQGWWYVGPAFGRRRLFMRAPGRATHEVRGLIVREQACRFVAFEMLRRILSRVPWPAIASAGVVDGEGVLRDRLTGA